MGISAVLKVEILIAICACLLAGPHKLYPKGLIQKKEKQVITETQDRYNALAVPGMIMLPTTGSSAVSPEILVRVDDLFARCLVGAEKIKPVLMTKWLAATYGTAKANNPFELMNAIRAEQYVVPVQFIGKWYIFRNERHYFLNLNVSSLEHYYPVEIFRVCANESKIPAAIQSCIDEMSVRLFGPVSPDARKRIVIEPFKLEFLRLVKLKSGEFEFIPTPFIEGPEIILREGDDFFSRTLGYILSTTDMFRVMSLTDYSEYVRTNFAAASTNADYRIQGRIQISDFECVLYVEMIDTRTNFKIFTARYPLPSYSYNQVWDACREISVQIAAKVLAPDSFRVVPELVFPSRGFFVNNRFMGWHSLKNVVLAKGLHKVDVGDFNGPSTRNITGAWAESAAYYIQLDDYFSFVHQNTEGEHIWNLLKKQQ
ncbi:MAG: hypothetical protein LBP76_11790 [Treponema sp.]|jgi:hypothetical protein|nr:hypothetical protein [Treponema sp.]